MKTLRLRRIALVALAALLWPIIGAEAAGSRIKDIASLQSGRDNQLIGYGLIVGLQGTGDSLRSSPFTDQSMRAMLQNLVSRGSAAPQRLHEDRDYRAVGRGTGVSGMSNSEGGHSPSLAVL